MIGWARGRRTVEVPCDVDLEQTQSSFHAHAIPQAVELRPGDVVVVHGAPAELPFGGRVAFQCRATVIRAGWFGRTWTRLAALLELTDLYEVGFAPKEVP